MAGIFVPWVSEGTMKEGMFHGSVMELCKQDALLVYEGTCKQECSMDKKGNQACRNVPLVSEGTQPAGMFCGLGREPYGHECSIG